MYVYTCTRYSSIHQEYLFQSTQSTSFLGVELSSYRDSNHFNSE